MTLEELRRHIFNKHGQLIHASILGEIQREAREGMVPVEDIRPLISWATESSWSKKEKFAVLETLRAKDPNLFTK